MLQTYCLQHFIFECVQQQIFVSLYSLFFDLKVKVWLRNRYSLFFNLKVEVWLRNHYSLFTSLRYRAQALTPSVVPSAVSTVTMICITVFQNSLFFIRFYFFVNNNYF